MKAIKSSQQSNTAAGNELQLQEEMADMGNKVKSLEEMKDTVSHLQVGVGLFVCVKDSMHADVILVLRGHNWVHFAHRP